jgi:hypothetical protein
MEIFTKIWLFVKIIILLQKFRLFNNRMKLIHKSYKFKIYPTKERDVNAAKNILKQGSVSGTESDIKQKQGEALPLGESATLEAQPIASGVGG